MQQSTRLSQYMTDTATFENHIQSLEVISKVQCRIQEQLLKTIAF